MNTFILKEILALGIRTIILCIGRKNLKISYVYINPRNLIRQARKCGT